jgi:hypothetical protein
MLLDVADEVFKNTCCVPVLLVEAYSCGLVGEPWLAQRDHTPVASSNSPKPMSVSHKMVSGNRVRLVQPA